jgi:hypothetical protein
MAPLLGIDPVDEGAPEIRRALIIDTPGGSIKKIAAN